MYFLRIMYPILIICIISILILFVPIVQNAGDKASPMIKNGQELADKYGIGIRGIYNYTIGNFKDLPDVMARKGNFYKQGDPPHYHRNRFGVLEHD